MLNVDISNIWCSVTLPEFLSQEQDVLAAHAALMDGNGADFLAWLDGEEDDGTLERLEEAAERIRDEAELLVVVGDDSATLGAQALLELLRGQIHQLRPGLKVVFTGGDLSTQAWRRLSAQLDTRDFCVHAIGRDGLCLQSAITLRSLRWALQRRYGNEKARERLFLTTDASKGALHQLALQTGCASFPLPRTLAGHASALAPSALLSLLAVQVDVRALLAGAAEARRAFELRSFENPVWLYSAARNILARRGRRVEYLSAAEPDAWTLCRWWQRLFGNRACLDGRGLIPAAAEIPADLQHLHGLLCDGKQPLLQTILRFAPPAQRQTVEMDLGNYDGLNCLNGFTLDYLQEQTVAGAVQAGVDGGVPLLTVDCGPLNARTAGELLYFFELSSSLCAGMLGRDPYADEPAAAFAAAAAALLGLDAEKPQ